MKLSTKTKLIPVLKTISSILEKCGGQGGTPGPCPTGGGGPEKIGVHKAAHKVLAEAGFRVTHSEGGTRDSRRPGSPYHEKQPHYTRLPTSSHDATVNEYGHWKVRSPDPNGGVGKYTKGEDHKSLKAHLQELKLLK